MTSYPELASRIKHYFRYNQQELSGLAAAIVVTAFIFSFRDWGAEEFDFISGMVNFLLVLVIASISFFFRTACQKIYGLSEGHKAEFKVWWTGLVISLVLAFITLGKLPTILAGGMVASFMIRHRLGEFRYGFSIWANGLIAYWGILGNLILAILFAIGVYVAPDNYFFTQGLILNLVFAVCALIPFPQLDGLNIFFGARWLYYLGIIATLFAGVLLLTNTKLGLITVIIVGTVYGLVYILIGSEK